MKTVIGVLWRNEDVLTLVRNLEKSGFSQEKIHVLTHISAVRKLLSIDKSHAVAKYAGWGTLGGVAVYAPFGVAAAVCECAMLHYEMTFGLGILIAFVLAGASIGAFMGSFIGADNREKESHQYTRSVALGGKLIVVEINELLQPKAINIFKQQHVMGVNVLASTH